MGNKLSSLKSWLKGGKGASRGRFAALLPPPEPFELDTPLIENEVALEPRSDAHEADRSLIARAFDSAHPVRTRDELFGRSAELSQLLSATLEFGQHTIIHGARGSGKTSLSRVFGDHADQAGVLVIYLACEAGATFADLLNPYLHALPSAAISASSRARFKEELSRLPAQFGPRAFVDLVVEHVTGQTVFIFDEFDCVVDPRTKADIAAAMKLLSDSLSSILFMLVGIARSVSDIVDSHPSLRRHMRVVSLGRIAADSVDALMDAGQNSTRLPFEASARAMIARASCGSPFHIRLFCHHAALAAVRQKSATVSEEHARTGLRTALENWAAMNVGDARRFVALIDSGHDVAELEQAARTAALNDRLPGGSDGTASLQPSLCEDDEGGDMVFRDSMAPQFLIACIILAAKTPDPAVPIPLFRGRNSVLSS